MSRLFICGLLLTACTSWCVAQDTPASEPSMADVAARGLEYMRETGQNEDGVFSPRVGSGVTSLAVTAALRLGCPLDDPLVAKGLKALESYVQPDGGIYGNARLRNYETCVAIVCLSEANKAAGDGRYHDILAAAEKLVRGFQVGASGDVDENDPQFGGVGYGGPERPDLSNTGYLLEALISTGATSDDEAVQRALVFVSRCQNLKGKWNDTQFGGLVNDGGFYYLIPTEKVDPSTSERYEANGGLRSYGSMTYTGFKSLVYAALTKNDPRTKAALDWISENYTLEQNPGQGTAGLFYYYNTFGSALGASGLDKISTDDQGERDWRKDLIAELAKTQQPDGSWVNSNRQWLENDPNLCTAFALLALSFCDDQPTPQ